MNINYIFEQYGYDKVPFEKLPQQTQGYITAMQYVTEDCIPSLLSELQYKNNKLIGKLKAEIAEEVLNELAAHLRVAQREMIITVVDRMNANGSD